ncbi:MAG: histidine phosphatase family protein [Anaerolineales bacterium]|nr:histidine phosphatase family protein [Anaerolineales bacterium]
MISNWVNSDGIGPTVYLARHGTPDWNMREIRYDIPPGPPLVPQGETEAGKLGEFLRDQGICKVYASPLVRAHRTAEIAAAHSKLPVTVLEGVAEMRRDESDEQVYQRFNPVFERVWAEAQTHGPIVIVSHGGPVRVMLDRLGIQTDFVWHYRRQFDSQNPLPPAGAWAVTRSPELGLWEAKLVFAPVPFTDYLPAVQYV